MNLTTRTVSVEDVIRKWAAGDGSVENEEREVVRVLGKDFLRRLRNPLVAEAALYDLEVIRDRQPDLPELQVARMLREADLERGG